MRLKTPSDLFWGLSPVNGFEGLTWDMKLIRNIPIRLFIKSGADESALDLRDLKVVEIKIETGASATHLILPAAAGLTNGSIQTGASSVDILVPEGVAARFLIKHGMAGISVNTARFVQNGNVYETPGFLASANRIEMTIETGVGSVEIR